MMEGILEGYEVGCTLVYSWQRNNPNPYTNVLPSRKYCIVLVCMCVYLAVKTLHNDFLELDPTEHEARETTVTHEA